MIGAMSLTEHFALQDGKGLLVDQSLARKQAREAIEQYAIKATPNSPIASLSGGNQQRAMLALLPALCAGILLEQPTRGLDVASARAIWGRLLARRESGAAVVFSSADLDEVLERSDQILVFFGGRISRPIPRQELTEARLAELIGGVGFDEVALSAERGVAHGS
jgi:simple sugar transport system ATP-binding protein